MSKINYRNKNSNRRKKLREAVRQQGDPCALCGMPIDYSLPARHPMSYELDEIIPISFGATPQDKVRLATTRENVQPVHRCCNQKKSNKLLKKVTTVIKNTGRAW